MKPIHISLLLFFVLTACSDNHEQLNNGGDINYRSEMRSFVINLSNYAKSISPGFIIIPQNGIELAVDNDSDMEPVTDYLEAIDGNGQEDLFYGYENDNVATPTNESDYLVEFLDISKNAENTILVTDYCSSQSNMQNSYEINISKGYVSFAADQRELNNIPAYPESPYGINDKNIENLGQVKNFLYLINPEKYNTKSDFLNALAATNYDLIIMDLFYNDGTSFTEQEVGTLKVKANGATRLVVAYMSIGEAEDYRFYWNNNWKPGDPDWLREVNPDWEGNYKVKYWDSEWQGIIFGNTTSFLDRIIASGFDGVYLDIIDAFEYFE